MSLQKIPPRSSAKDYTQQVSATCGGPWTIYGLVIVSPALVQRTKHSAFTSWKRRPVIGLIACSDLIRHPRRRLFHTSTPLYSPRPSHREMQPRRRLEVPPVKAACLAWYAQDLEKESLDRFEHLTKTNVAALQKPAAMAKTRVTE